MASRHEQSAGNALNGARDDQLTDAFSQPAANRREREESDAGAEDAPPAEAVAHRSASQKQGGEKKRVGFDYPLHVENRRVEVFLQRGQRDVDDRAIDEGHARPQNGRGQNPRLGHTHAWNSRRPRSNNAFIAWLRKNIRHRLNSFPVNQELRTV
jgi:hypothetical protein